MRIAVLLATLVLAVGAARAADTASPDETARFLAGMPVPASSPLSPLTKERYWQQHAGSLGTAFNNVEARQLAKVRAWSKANITVRKPVLYYMFAGADFLYANAFFGDADTYVMAGLEPTGPIPDLLKIKGSLPASLSGLQSSMRSLLSISFFLTKNMQKQFRETALTGTLPVLYVFLVRSGKTLKDASLVYLGDDGEVIEGARPAGKAGAQGTKITFTSAEGKPQTLYYFSANIANDGFKGSGIGALAQKLGPGNAFVKSASYLMHSGSFSQVRDMLLERSAAILQDDSGVPLAYFDRAKWELKPHGRYLGPIGLFASSNQPKLRDVFKGAPTIDFGVGYRYKANESNLMLAIKKDGPATQ